MKSPERIAEQRLWREQRDARFRDHPAEKVALFAPYVAAAKERMAGRETPDDVTRLLVLVGCPHWLRKPARKSILASQAAADVAPRLRRQGEYLPQTVVIHEDRYRSPWERRLAAAFDRLGIAYRYESASFDYQDAKGRDHRYTPDFTLTDLHMTFVEVKGPAGASSPDRVKMWHVLRRHSITLLLWDASAIEMIEDMQHASEVMGLLSRTRLVAAA